MRAKNHASQHYCRAQVLRSLVFCSTPRPNLLPISGSTRQAQYMARSFCGSSCMRTGASTAGEGERSGSLAGAAGNLGTKALPEINDYSQQRKSEGSFRAGTSSPGRFVRTVERRGARWHHILPGSAPGGDSRRCFNEDRGRVTETGVAIDALED